MPPKGTKSAAKVKASTRAKKSAAPENQPINSQMERARVCAVETACYPKKIHSIRKGFTDQQMAVIERLGMHGVVMAPDIVINPTTDELDLMQGVTPVKRKQRVKTFTRKRT